MTKYQEFIKVLNILSEESFNEVIASLPEVDINKVEFDTDTVLFDESELSFSIISSIIYDITNFAWIDVVDFKNKSFEVYDIESLEEIKKIEETFPLWTINNKEVIVQKVKEEEIETRKEFILNALAQLSLEKLEKLISTIEYDDKKKSLS